MQGVIYIIRNNINGKVYIGQTIQPLKERWYRHCGKTGISESESRMAIKRAILKYGKENFTIEILEECNQEDLNAREKYYIDMYDSYKSGYNSTLGGQEGLNIPFVKISKDKHGEIIDLYKSGLSLRSIAVNYNVDKHTIKHILDYYNIPLRKTRTYKFSEKERCKILEDYNNGISRKEIQDKWKVSRSYLSQLINGRRNV